jgi:N-acetylglucosaminyl-diphospho-decaprenol L-rhamnosyltransferase
VFRREALIRAGLFDPRLFLYFEEDDIAIRLIKHGYRLYVTDRAVVVHLSGKGSGLSPATARGEILLDSQYAFFRKHYGAGYAWAAFFALWAVLSVIVPYQHCLGRPHRALTFALWRWHLRRLLGGGAAAAGTSRARGPKGVDSRSASPMEKRG